MCLNIDEPKYVHLGRRSSNKLHGCHYSCGLRVKNDFVRVHEFEYDNKVHNTWRKNNHSRRQNNHICNILDLICKNFEACPALIT
jgi:hypothetical protein